MHEPIVIVGAGFLGQALADRLRAHGRTVRATSRSGDENRQTISLDILESDANEIAHALAGAGSIVLCYSSGGRQDRRHLFLDGGARVLEACALVSPKRVVYTSSTSALPDLDDILDEDCEAWPTNERGKVQREAEALMVQRLGGAGIPYVVLRLAGLYGPGRDLGRIYRSDPAGVLPGDGMRPTNLVHRDDVVEAIVAALELPTDVSALIHVCDDDHTPRREMMARVAASLGKGSPRWERDPAPSARPRGKRVSNTRMKQLLGLSLRYPEHLLPAAAEKPPRSGH